MASLYVHCFLSNEILITRIELRNMVVVFDACCGLMVHATRHDWHGDSVDSYYYCRSTIVLPWA